MLQERGFIQKLSRKKIQFTPPILLSIWHGSVYQAILLDFVLFLICYVLVTLIYFFIIEPNEKHKKDYEQMIKYLTVLQENTPLDYLVGFFVTSMLKRWLDICFSVPRLDSFATIVQTFIPSTVHIRNTKAGIDKEMRRCLLRYINLAWFLQLVHISYQLQKRFPLFMRKKNSFPTGIRDRLNQLNDDEMVQKTFGELVSQSEIEVFETYAMVMHESELQHKIPFWPPLLWAIRLISTGVESGVISRSVDRELINNIFSLRSQLKAMYIQGTTSIPLVYVQTVTIAVYSYFICEIFTGLDKTVEKVKDFPNAYVPVRSIFKFIFYVGWFKVATNILNPFGVDPQDFAVSRVFSDNLRLCFISALAADDFLFPPALDIYIADELVSKAHEKATVMGHRLVNPLETVAEHQIRRAAGAVPEEFYMVPRNLPISSQLHRMRTAAAGAAEAAIGRPTPESDNSRKKSKKKSKKKKKKNRTYDPVEGIPVDADMSSSSLFSPNNMLKMPQPAASPTENDQTQKITERV